MAAKRKPYDLKPIEPIIANEPAVAYGPERYANLATVVYGEKLDDSLSDLNIIALIRRGLDKESIYRIANLLDISIEKMCSLVHLSTRTLQRKTNKEPLGALVSERAIDLAKILIHGARALGNLSGFQAWLKAPRPALGGEPPISLMDTAIGCELVDDILGRIEHGVHS